MDLQDMSTRVAAREYAGSIKKAADFFMTLARHNELPMNRREFEERVKHFFESLDARLEASNALILAVLLDEPVPAKHFRAWASRQKMYHWSKLPEHESPLEVVVLNRKLCCRPSRFFACLQRHGRRQEEQR